MNVEIRLTDSRMRDAAARVSAIWHHAAGYSATDMNPNPFNMIARELRKDAGTWDQLDSLCAWCEDFMDQVEREYPLAAA